VSLSQVVRASIVSWLCACACASHRIVDGSGGSGSGGDSNDTHTLASPAEFIRQFADSVCNGFNKCCGEQGFAFDAAACPATIASQITPELTKLEMLQVDWDPDAAARCIQDYSDAVCGERVVADLKRNCSLMFRGRVAAGQPCTDEAECGAAPGGTAHCDLAATGLCSIEAGATRGKRSEACNGTCTLDDGTACANGLYNQNTAPGADTLPLCSKSEGLQCSPDAVLGWNCQPLLAIGDSCANNLGGCSQGAFCNVDTSVCTAQLPLGAASCARFDAACQPPAVCDYQTDECAALKLNGESCDSSSTNCQSGYCNAAGVCSRPELAASLCADPSLL